MLSQELVDHFSTLLSPSTSNFSGETLHSLDRMPQLFNGSNVAQGIRQLKRNKSLGNCHISAEVLKCLSSDSFCLIVAGMFNYFSMHGLPSTC